MTQSITVNVTGKLTLEISGSEIVTENAINKETKSGYTVADISYKRYNSPQELEADGLTEVAKIVSDSHYFDIISGVETPLTLQNIRITVNIPNGEPLQYDSLMSNKPKSLFDIMWNYYNKIYCSLDINEINLNLRKYINQDITEHLDTNYIWWIIQRDVLDELYSKNTVGI